MCTRQGRVDKFLGAILGFKGRVVVHQVVRGLRERENVIEGAREREKEREKEREREGKRESEKKRGISLMGSPNSTTTPCQ